MAEPALSKVIRLRLREETIDLALDSIRKAILDYRADLEEERARVEPVTQECPGAGYPNKWNWHECGGEIRRYPTLLCSHCLSKGTDFDPLERLKALMKEQADG